MIAILTKKNSYTGREYAYQLFKKNIDFILIQIGKKTSNSIEINRTNRLWKPVSIRELRKKKIRIFNFDKFNSCFYKLISKEKIDLAIQAGVGILGKKIIKFFKKGIINCHPGDIPEYRGSSCPEYQILDKKKVLVTFHYIDEKIDSGYLILKKELKLNYNSYYKMRSTIYPEIAKELVILLMKLNKLKKKKISINNSFLRPYIGHKNIILLIKNWKKYKPLKLVKYNK